MCTCIEFIENFLPIHALDFRWLMKMSMFEKELLIDAKFNCQYCIAYLGLADYFLFFHSVKNFTMFFCLSSMIHGTKQ